MREHQVQRQIECEGQCAEQPGEYLCGLRLVRRVGQPDPQGPGTG